MSAVKQKNITYIRRSLSTACRCVSVYGCLLLLSVSSFRSVTAGVIRHDRPDSSYTSLASSYPSVGRLTWPGYICSATLIAENWILTAGHCLDGGGLSASDFQFNLADSGGGTHTGAEIILHPGWVGDLNDGTDIALLRLATNETTVTPSPINTNTSEVGRTAGHAGYGRTGTGLTEMNAPAGTKRAGYNVVDVDGGSVGGYNDKVLFEDFDSGSAGDNWPGSATQLDLEYLIASGDSGGGMFMNFGLGDVLTGVHSFIAAWDGNLDGDYGDLAGSTRVSSYESSIMTETAGAASGAVAPELASWLIWMLLASGLLWRCHSHAAARTTVSAPIGSSNKQQTNG
ncbi:MAG: S1 family peptidase [Fuerstiella sp.]|nr:S1 family peptidase [Fuerstiella sp.]